MRHTLIKRLFSDGAFLGAICLLAPTATAQTKAGPFDYETVTIASGVYGFLEKRLNPIVSSNIVAVVGQSSVLVFDAGHHPTITRQIISDLKRLTDKPVRFVVNSHWHHDHWIGNAEFAKAYPGVEFIAHEFTGKLIETLRESFRGEPCKEDLVSSSRSLRDQLASGKRADGTAIPQASMQRLRNFAEAIDAQTLECDAMQFQGIDHPMTGKRVIDLGGRTVELSSLGRGNTAGDVIAYLPDAKVVLTGDLVVHPFPFATQSYITEWATVLRALDRMEFTQLVPGHGPVMRDRNYLHDVTAVLAAIDSQARAVYKPGMTADSLRAAIDLSALGDRFAKGDAFIKANFNAQMKGPAIERMWQELSGQWKPEGEAATATGSSAKRP